MSEKLYSVRLKSGRYILNCDDNWYETCDYDNRFFTKEEALKIKDQLIHHFQYYAVLCSEDGEEVFDHLESGKQNRASTNFIMEESEVDFF